MVVRSLPCHNLMSGTQNRVRANNQPPGKISIPFLSPPQSSSSRRPPPPISNPLSTCHLLPPISIVRIQNSNDKHTCTTQYLLPYLLHFFPCASLQSQSLSPESCRGHTPADKLSCRCRNLVEAAPLPESSVTLTGIA
jgi:hypothetical protein